MGRRTSIIPADLERIAERVVSDYFGTDPEVLIGAIAAAIDVSRKKAVTKERERCSRVAHKESLRWRMEAQRATSDQDRLVYDDAAEVCMRVAGAILKTEA